MRNPLRLLPALANLPARQPETAPRYPLDQMPLLGSPPPRSTRKRSSSFPLGGTGPGMIHEELHISPVPSPTVGPLLFCFVYPAEAAVCHFRCSLKLIGLPRTMVGLARPLSISISQRSNLSFNLASCLESLRCMTNWYCVSCLPSWLQVKSKQSQPTASSRDARLGRPGPGLARHPSPAMGGCIAKIHTRAVRG